MTEARQEAGRRDGAERTTRTTGTPCWVSLRTHGTTATQDFYHALFGWEFRPGTRPDGSVRALLDGREVAGIGPSPGHRRLAPAWTPQLSCGAVDATADRVRHCGGTVAVGPLETVDDGRLAIAADPGGAVFGIGPGAPGGTAATGVPGTPVWHALRSPDPVGVAAFYGYVFGLTAVPCDGGGPDALTLLADGTPVAELTGTDEAARGRGAHWLTYFAVGDVDASVHRITALGGRVLAPPADGARGRSATVTDPDGAVFGLLARG
ncbi:VOC family protein [Streptomyces sp. JNUCC 64]